MNLVQKFLTKNPCYQANVNKADSRYTTFQQRGPQGLMLHSVGCAQPNAMVFINGWNSETYTYSCVHGIIDANDGTVYQTLPWNFRGWHGGGSSNNTHVGVEMCESKHIRYLLPEEPGYAPGKFVVTDAAKAKADCKRAYDSAVELYASLCEEYNLDPLKDIVSHYEGGQKGIASAHGDPEHYWKGLGMSYTMNGFRADVKKCMEKNSAPDLKAELIAYIDQKVDTAISNACVTLAAAYGNALDIALESIDDQITNAVDKSTGEFIEHLKDIPSKSVKKDIQELLACGAINGGTPANVDDSDINMRYQDVRVMAVLKRYVDMKIKEE